MDPTFKKIPIAEYETSKAFFLLYWEAYFKMLEVN